MNQPKLTSAEQLQERDFAIKGRSMVVDEFESMISVCWDKWPIGWRKSAVNVAGFVGDDARALCDLHWREISPVNKGLISNGVVRIMQLTNFVRGALL